MRRKIDYLKIIIHLLLVRRRTTLSGMLLWLSVVGLHGQSSADNTAQASADTTDIYKSESLQEVTITRRKAGTTRATGVFNGTTINKDELFRAACCNLGESFTTNPSVDVSYSDATTGAKQIKLLGLSGTYVQMLTENIPNFRGAAIPYALGYVPGPWMKSIQVSKGSASVRNGYESITGQIDIEYLKPDDDEGVTLNLYGNTKSRLEANADGNIHLDDKLSTELLMHYENDFGHHDDNDDGFLDTPNVRQYNLQNRWKFKGDSYIFHGGLSLLKETRESGQVEGHHSAPHTQGSPLYKIGIETDRYEGYMKHAFILNKEHGTNVALMASASMHETAGEFGDKAYYANEKNAYAQLMFETNFTEQHNLSAGLSLNHDYIGQRRNGVRSTEKETVPGIYAQYTYTLGTQLTAMAGLRVDNSNIYGTFVTPRVHLKYTPHEVVSFRLSAGKGYRTVHALAENNYLLASGRDLVVADNLKQEEAWNYGASAQFNIPLFGNTLKLNAEYYYTHFINQTVVDYEVTDYQIHIHDLDGKSYSHTFQIDATYPLFEGMTLTAAYRLNDVKSTFGGELREKPLTNRYKGLITASYKTPLGLWQFDATLQLNGGGRLPMVLLPDGGPVEWDEHFPAYPQLSAQITRWFRHFSVYVGGENLTGYTQKNPILQADMPWSSGFEPTLVWGPVHGAMFYAGIRVNLGKRM